MGSYEEWSAFYDTDEWDDMRYSTIRKYGRRCMKCGATNTELHVDHIRPRSMYPELSLDPNNLQVLCRECNYEKGSRIADYRLPSVPYGPQKNDRWIILLAVFMFALVVLIRNLI